MDLIKIGILLIQLGTAPSFPNGDDSIQKALASKITVICRSENSIADTLHVLRNNPEFKKTTPSLFTTENIGNSYMFLTQIDSTYLFAEDCDYSMLKYLRHETNINDLSFTLNDSAEDIASTGSVRKITWNDGIALKLFEDNNIYTTKFDSYTEYWNCGEKKEYGLKYPYIKPVETSLRKNLSKKQSTSIYDVLTTPIFVFSIIPGDTNSNAFMSNFSGKSTKTALYTAKGEKIEGRGIDLNGDKNIDAFWYVDVVDSQVAEWYARLYINLSGEWCPIWYTYFREQ